MTVQMFRSTSIKPGWLWYRFPQDGVENIIGYGDAPRLRSTCQNTGRVLWLPLNLVKAGGNEAESLTQTQNGKFSRIPADKYFGSPPLAPPVTPPVTPPDDEPAEPPVIIPPVVPPVIPPTQYKIKKIIHTDDFPTIVFFGVADGLRGRLISPSFVITNFITGTKPEFGKGGTEAGYAIQEGYYSLIINRVEFIIEMRGKFTKIEFEPATDTPPVEETVVLRSGWMTRTKAVELLLKLQVLYKDIFRIE